MTTNLFTQEFIDQLDPAFVAEYDAKVQTTKALDEDGFPIEMEVDGRTRFLSRTVGR